MDSTLVHQCRNDHKESRRGHIDLQKSPSSSYGLFKVRLCGVRVNLLENLVDVDAVRLLSLRRLLLLVRGLRNEWLGILALLLAALGRFTFGRHFHR